MSTSSPATRTQDTAPAIDADIAGLAASIDINSALSVQQFGRELAERSASYADAILAAARSTELEQTGRELNEIVVAAQQFNVDSLDNPASRTPIVGPLLKKFSLTREKALARFDTVKSQVDKLVERVEQTADTLDRRNTDYHAMYESVRQEHAALGRHVEALELRLADVDAEIARLGASGDAESNERLSVLASIRNQMLKRADDMRVLQHAAMQTLPMVRIIQSNNLTLIDKFQNIRQLTLPAWKRAFMLALTLDEQKNAVQLADSIDNATNAMMRRNAELLHENSVATARANQRLVVDVSTLKHVHEQILRTLEDVRHEHEQGQAQRREALGELDRLRLEMAGAVKALAVGDTARG
jgi:uncharacterized protein YaaN involved in tellurite resistance